MQYFFYKTKLNVFIRDHNLLHISIILNKIWIELNMANISRYTNDELSNKGMEVDFD